MNLNWFFARTDMDKEGAPIKYMEGGKIHNLYHPNKWFFDYNYLFLIDVVIDEFIRDIQNEIPYYILFTDNIILVDRTSARVNVMLEL